MDGLSSRVERAEERISKFENRTTIDFKNEQSQESLEYNKRSNICVIRVLEGEKEGVVEKYSMK